MLDLSANSIELGCQFYNSGIQINLNFSGRKRMVHVWKMLLFWKKFKLRLKPLSHSTLLAVLASLIVTLPAQAQDKREQLLKRIEGLEKRIIELETTTVLSDPETSVKKVEVFIDESGVEHEKQVPGSKKIVTYQRERVYRRQTINEKIEEALDDAASRSVQLGIDAAIVIQNVQQTKGNKKVADGNTYQLASTDLYFTAGLAQYTVFFADMVGLSGTQPDAEINGLTSVNGYSARLVKQNDLSLREAWLMTELLDQKLSLTLGRIDLTHYFDANAAANDETTQFLSDALVNNPALGLSENGAGMAFVYDPKTSFALKVGYQQSSSTATSLSDSLYQLYEVDYKGNPFSAGEGNYRVWYRKDNTGNGLSAYGISLDQKLSAGVTLFARYGSAETSSGGKRDKYYSTGLQFSAGLGFNPEDTWGIGYADADQGSNDKEQIFESYYNLRIADKLQLSFHLTYLTEEPAGTEKVSYLVSGTRLQASF
ncbi:hypothetical protein JYT31_01575 [Beggiatoa alba]|nr:hypothetical protein [Beggiatoa alba]